MQETGADPVRGGNEWTDEMGQGLSLGSVEDGPSERLFRDVVSLFPLLPIGIGGYSLDGGKK